MKNKVRQYIDELGLIKSGDRLVAGVSGGPDSMALLHIIASLRASLGIELVAAHVNHGLRPGAHEEQDYVEQVCRNLKVDFFSCQLDIEAIASRDKKTLEEAGRDERYRFFRDISRQTAAGLIVTAHHRDDVAETVLLHLLRGSGLKGLRGIIPRQGDLVRPLLCVDKEDILLYLKKENIRYYIDESNKDLRYTRNRIRQELIPLLKDGYNARIVDNLNQLALIARDEDCWLEHLTNYYYANALLAEGGSKDEIILDVAFLLEQPVACQRRVLNTALIRLGGYGGWQMRDIESIRDLQIKPGSTRHLYLKKGIKVRKVYQRLIFSKELPDKAAYYYTIKELPCCLDVLETGEKFYFEMINQPVQSNENKGVLYIDYDKINGELCLRSRRKGDRIKPAGGGGSKKLKKYFIDLKIPWENRETIALLASGSEILAIPGMCLSQKVQPNINTRRFLAVSRKPLSVGDY